MNMQKVFLIALGLALGAMALVGNSQAAEEAALPNVVIFYIDDQGYGDLGCYGSETNKTPNIDRLAEEGIRFTDFYSAYCVCSASRAALMTGCYQPRINMQGVLGPTSMTGLHVDEVTIADMLKTKGYATACVGKWHCGHTPGNLPTKQGFDSYFGLPFSNDMARVKGVGNNTADLDELWIDKNTSVHNVPLYRDEEIIENPVNQITLTDRYTEECLRFINESKDGPFFLYMAHTMVHVPLFAPEDRYDPDPKKAHKIVTEQIDDSVGQVVRTLKDLGLKENTLIIYASDNGPWLSKDHHAGNAGPLRDGKATTYEGGMRVPGIFSWPGKIPEGVVSGKVVGTIDVLPTLAKIVGAELPEDRPIDGRDVSALLKDPSSPSPHEEEGYFYYKNGHADAVRVGKWKLRMAPGKKMKEADIVTELYDLEADIAESKNLAEQHPEIVSRLKKRIAEYDADLKANSRPCWPAPEKEKKAAPKKKAKADSHEI